MTATLQGELLLPPSPAFSFQSRHSWSQRSSSLASTTVMLCLRGCRAPLQTHYNLRLRDHVTPLKQLHWLPVASRIRFKLCLLMHLIHTGRAPQYLVDSVQSVISQRHFRSSETTNYVKHTTRTKFGERGFSYSGPAAWNSLPFSSSNND